MDSAAFNMLEDHPTAVTTSHMESLSHHDNDTIIQTKAPSIGSAESRQDDGRPHDDSTEPVPGRKRKQYPSTGAYTVDSPSDEPSKETPDGYIHIGYDNPGRIKKPRLDHDKTANKSPLPMEIWHCIFSYLDPRTLGALLRVNKTFHSFLASKQTGLTENSSSAHGILKPLSADLIWASARKSYYSGMPRPLANMTELDMWKLIGTATCQTCGKNDPTNQLPTCQVPSWERGPGTNGVRIFWPFGIRTCSKCFLEHTKKVSLPIVWNLIVAYASFQKDVDLLLSSFPSILLPGLSFVLLTSSMHMVSSVTLRLADIPTDLQLSKYYSNSEIDQLMNEFHHVKSLGPAALEEWMKGLESMGKRKLSDAARWEQWENSGGLHEARLRIYRKATNYLPYGRGRPGSERSSWSPTESINGKYD